MTSYSIIVETDNLSAADSGRLQACLHSIEKSIARQPVPNEVMVFDTGKAPPELLREVQRRFPWLSVRQAGPGVGYYGCKMLGARAASSDVIVLV